MGVCVVRKTVGAYIVCGFGVGQGKMLWLTYKRST